MAIQAGVVDRDVQWYVKTVFSSSSRAARIRQTVKRRTSALVGADTGVSYPATSEPTHK